MVLLHVKVVRLYRYDRFRAQKEEQSNNSIACFPSCYYVPIRLGRSQIRRWWTNILFVYAKLVCAHGHVRILWPIRARTIRSKVPLVEEVHNPNATDPIFRCHVPLDSKHNVARMHVPESVLGLLSHLRHHHHMLLSQFLHPVLYQALQRPTSSSPRSSSHRCCCCCAHQERLDRAAETNSLLHFIDNRFFYTLFYYFYISHSLLRIVVLKENSI